MPELRPTGRSPHQVVEVGPARCPGCGHAWPRGVAGRVLVGMHKCSNHMHRTYFCQKCQQTAFDPTVEQGCREALRLGTPDGGLTE
jgi:hypothetical protein